MKKTNYIICKEENRDKFIKLGYSTFCELEDMVLYDTIAFDFETEGLQARKNDVFCCQIGNGKDANYIVVLYDNNYKLPDLWPYIQDKTMCLHNSLFDLGFFYKYNFFPEKILDTILASRIIYNGDIENMRHDFGSVMKRELDVYYDKTDQKNIHIVKLSQTSTIKYSFNDVDRLLELHDSLYKKIINGGFEETYKLHCRYIKALAYMEQCGLPISSEKWKAKMDEDIINTFKWKKKIQEYIYDNIPQFANQQVDLFDEEKRIHISIESPKQMLKVFEALKIPTKDKDGKDSINENIISKSKHEFVKLWLDFQEANHRVSTFGASIYNQIENERIYTNFNPMVDTARLSTRKGNINFLNFPSDSITRECFVANKGNVLVVADFEAQEGLILTDKTKDEAMIKSVLEGVDLHCLLTRKVYPEVEDLSDEEIKNKHKDKRNVSKIVRFLFSYGGNSYTLHMNEGFPLSEAIEIEKAFKDLHKGVYAWGETVYQKSIKQGYIESEAGWKLKLPKFDKFLEYKTKVENISKEQWQVYKQGKLDYKKQQEEKEKGKTYTLKFPRSVEFYKENKQQVSQFFKLKSEYQRLSLNAPIQTCGSHMTKLATCLLFEWIKENNYLNKVLITNAVHDELIIECPEELKEIVTPIVEKSMKNGGDFYLKDFTIGATAHYGNSWESAKKG